MRRRMIGAGVVTAAAVAAAAAALAADVPPAHDASPARQPGTILATPETFKTVFAAAQGGATILLGSGDYGVWTGGAKREAVTIRPSSGADVRLAVRFDPSVRNLRLDGFRALGGQLINGAQDVTISNSTFTSGLAIIGPTSNIVLDADTFDDLPPATWEGRVSLAQGATGVTIRNSHFGGAAGCSDGVFVGTARGNTIGPGNEFAGITQGACTAHTDPVQLYDGSHTTVTGNYFHGNDTIIMAPDGGEHVVISDNVMVGDGYRPAVQLGSHSGTSFVHNTVANIDVAMDHKPGQPASRNGTVRDNVFAHASTNALVPGNCTSCSVDHNLFTSPVEAAGTDTVIGTPIFSGGAAPGALTGFRLAATSPGRAEATDGGELGARFTR